MLLLLEEHAEMQWVARRKLLLWHQAIGLQPSSAPTPKPAVPRLTVLAESICRGLSCAVAPHPPYCLPSYRCQAQAVFKDVRSQGKESGKGKGWW